MQYSNIFIKILRPVEENKKSALINDWENINSFREESKQSVDTKVWFVLHTVVRSGGYSIAGKFGSFFSNLTLESLNCYVNFNVSFS